MTVTHDIAGADDIAVPATSRQWRLAARPRGLPVASDWEFRTEAIATPAEGEVLVRVRYISIDPAMRGWMNEGRSYVPAVGIGDVMRATGVGQVVASRHAGITAGDYVTGALGVQEYVVTDGARLTRVSAEVAPLTRYLSVLGIAGMAAYFGLLDIGKPVAGETVVVSAAAGAVGQVAGQIAKLKGCRVVGIAGGPEKCRHLIDTLGFDATIDYKNEDVRTALQERCPDRINVYFDNTGGDILDAVLTHLARHARIVICGSTSQYNNDGPMRGPANYMNLLVDRARMEGFVTFDYVARYAEAGAEMAGWMAQGLLRSTEDMVSGIEQFPDAFLKLFRGESLGKLILDLGGDAT
jgi:NADPH-dependent curcumin reductase CurA